MTNHKSSVKALNQSVKKTIRNKSIHTRIKTHIKEIEHQILAKNFKGAEQALKTAESFIMKSVTKKFLKLNTASRQVSKMTHKVKLLKPYRKMEK